MSFPLSHGDAAPGQRDGRSGRRGAPGHCWSCRPALVCYCCVRTFVDSWRFLPCFYACKRKLCLMGRNSHEMLTTVICQRLRGVISKTTTSPLQNNSPAGLSQCVCGFDDITAKGHDLHSEGSKGHWRTAVTVNNPGKTTPVELEVFHFAV